MKPEIKNLGIIFINRNYLEYFDSNKSKVFSFNFPSSIVKDLEILNNHDLETQLILFINFYKLNPSPLLLILASDICFETEINEINETNFETIAGDFVNHLPFEESVHKLYKQPKGYRLVAVNKEIIDNLKFIFTKMGFSIEGAVPASVVGINIKTIDAPSANYIFAKINLIKSMSIIQAEVKTPINNAEPKKVLGVKRVFLLLSFFLVLLMIMLFLLYKQSTGI